MTPCTGILGRLFGHKYEARYSKGVPASLRFEVSALHDPMTVVRGMEAAKPVTYHHDICCRCGHVVNKEQK